MPNKKQSLYVFLVVAVAAVLLGSVIWLWTRPPKKSCHAPGSARLLKSSGIYQPDTGLSIARPTLPELRTVTSQEMLGAIQKQDRALFIRDNKCLDNKWAKITMEQLSDFFVQNGIKQRLMISPSGVVGWYDSTMIDVSVDSGTGQIWGRAKPTFVAQHRECVPTPFPLPHVQYDDDPDNLNQYIRGDHDRNKTKFYIAPNERYYLRTLHSPKFVEMFRDCIPDCYPLNPEMLEHVNFYVSGAGIVTNLHVDGKSGCIVQLKGRKRVYVFPPSDRQHMAFYPPTHPLMRRSTIDCKLSEAVLDQYPSLKNCQGWEYVLEPGSWLYIPAQWIHYVETLDPETYSLVVRFLA